MLKEVGNELVAENFGVKNLYHERKSRRKKGVSTTRQLTCGIR